MSLIGLLVIWILLSWTAVHAATTTVNEDFEDGTYTYIARSSMKVLPVILEEGGNKFLRITGSEGDCSSLPADLCPTRNRSMVNFTSHPRDMPLLSDATMRQTYSARMRINTNPAGGCSAMEFFQHAPGEESCGYACLNGNGPVVRFVALKGGGMLLNVQYDNETKRTDYDLGVSANAWHTYTLVAVWSHDPSVGRLEAFVDGVKKVTVSGRDVNLGPDSDRIPQVKMGLYGDLCRGTNDIDDLHFNPTGATEPAPTPPAVRYVSQTGSGTTCTQAAPCTFTQATTNLPAGSTLRLTGTVTADCNNCLPSGLSATQPTILESATTGSAVQVGADRVSSTPGTATLQASTATVLNLQNPRILVRKLNITTTGSGTNPAVQVNAADVTFEDVELQAPTRSGDTACLRSDKTATARLTLRRLRVHRCGPAVNFTNLSPTVHGLNLAGTDIVLEDSDLWDNHAHGAQFIDPASTTTANSRAQIRRNRAFGNGARGIFMTHGTGMILTRNVSYENGAYGFYVGAPTMQFVVYANTCHANSKQSGSSFPCFFVNAGQSTGVLRNNIAIGNPPAEYSILISGAQIACSHNRSGDASETATCTNMGLNAVAADVWVDPTNATLANRDYKLDVGSVAIDSGTTGICTSADVTAARCTPALTINTFFDVGPDQGAYEVDAPDPAMTISRYLLNNSVVDDIGPNEGTNTGVTFDSTNKVEGTHSALFDATGDRIVVGVAGWNRQAFTIRLAGRPTVCPTTTPFYLLGHTSSDASYVNRIQIYINPGCTLGIGLGGSHTTIPNAGEMPLNVWDRILLVVQEGAVSGSGTANLYRNGTLIQTATYSGLTQLGTTATIGNNGLNQAEGWRGQIDAVLIDNYALSATEIAADCTTYCAGAPPFTELILGSCEIGTLAANKIACTVASNPDPSTVCTSLADYSVTYNTVAQTTTACALTGTTLTLTLGASATHGDLVELFYLFGGDEYAVTNNIDPVTFPPLVLTTCATDASGVNVTCGLLNTSDASKCQDLTNFRVTDDCVPVTVLGCTIAERTLTLERETPPSTATEPLALELRDEVQVVAITNNFVPGTPRGEDPPPPVTGDPPTFVASGTLVQSTGAIAVPLPPNLQSNDLLLLVVEHQNQPVAISNANGGTWAQVAGSPAGGGTAGASGARGLSIFWSRYNGTQGNPTISDGGDHQGARILAYRGVRTTGNPWDVTSSGQEAQGDTSIAVTGATTTVANTRVVVAIGGTMPSNLSYANANLASLAELINDNITTSGQGVLGVAHGTFVGPGAYGTTTVTSSANINAAFITLALVGGP